MKTLIPSSSSSLWMIPAGDVVPVEIHYTIARCDRGFVIKPVDKLNNRRWYFDFYSQALDWLQYLESQ